MDSSELTCDTNLNQNSDNKENISSITNRELINAVKEAFISDNCGESGHENSNTNTRTRNDSSTCYGPPKTANTRHTNYLNNTTAVDQNVFRMGSLYHYIHSELRRDYALENDEQRYTERREKFYIFLKIPCELERFLWYGLFQCIDAFLFVFTLLPIRVILALWLLISRSFKKAICYVTAKSKGTTFIFQPTLQSAEICDLFKGVIVISGAVLLSYVDTSMLYHIIKSQSVIKLYIFFNMLEVADKLLSSFGQDILDALFWTANESRSKKREHLGVVPHLAMAIGYVFVHSLLVLLQATTLNVALNSKNKALLTVMMSNNFVELKGMVFKKFEKNNLFHMSCSDVRERFHYIILLIVVIIQTMKEYNWSEKQFWILFPDCLLVFIAEIFVDWCKHAFVTRYNEISFEVYEDYAISLAYDLASSKLRSAFSDHSDLVSRRMGFIPLPLGVLVIRVFCGSFCFNFYSFWYTVLCLFISYLCLISFKLVINIVLLGYACDLIDQHRKTLDSKLICLSRQCTSLPASRHNSSENLENLAENASKAKSTPHTPNASARSSLADITEQASIMQETLETSMVFSNSTVSLMSLEINDGSNIKLFGDNTSDLKQKSILRQRNTKDKLQRRVSLQEVSSNSSVTYLDLSLENTGYK